MADWQVLCLALLGLMVSVIIFEPYLQKWFYRCANCRCRIGHHWDESSDRFTVSKFHCGACGSIQTVRVNEHQ